ncbi:MAG TPA: glycogen/starch/alpha-glucan phosphorylase [Bacilli bacterium]|nr:glycogen/starch/alpha-glucan phosphorylase [Bacilli bacterium]
MFTSIKNFQSEYKTRLDAKYGVSVADSHVTERYDILGSMVRDYANTSWRESKDTVNKKHKKQLIYFSMEFLIGRLLTNNLINLGIYELVNDGLKDLGINLHDLEEEESDAGLGNGGLGRLAACFLDSIASLGYAGNGHTIRYEYGFFRQKIVDNKQIELPDQWLVNGNVWEVRKPKHAVDVKFYGHAETYRKKDGTFGIKTVNPTVVKAVPYDMTVIGYGNEVANTLRLWSAEPSEDKLPTREPFDQYLTTLREINHGLYPDDSTEKGKMLRLRQQYFLVSAGLQSAVRGHLRRHGTLRNFAELYVFQLNDTHPILGIPELMRILVDDHEFGWDEAWSIVTKTFAYTNHTVMIEALEKWPIHYVQHLVPRNYMIIEEIHRRHQKELAEKGASAAEKSAMAILRDGMIHMTNLAIVTCFSVNGVAALHTEILKGQTFKEFYKYYPEKFNNKTNGITHRRWFLASNPELSSYLTNLIGASYITNPDDFEKLIPYINDKKVQKKFFQIKKQKKEVLAAYIKEHNGITIDVDSIFDVQIKRLHAYKRQLMNVFRIMTLYFALKRDPKFKMHPITFIFGAKAAPSYYFAKKVIELINSVAEVINNDREVNGLMKVVFIENYGVRTAEIIIPATDISEQISTAGKEASGTGNMKFMMNGALTLGTLDGANVEINERVGDEHSFIFGLREPEVLKLKAENGYSPWVVYETNPEIKRVLDSLIDGTWSNGNPHTFKPIFDEIMNRGDEFLVLKDLPAYVKRTDDIVTYYRDKAKWAESALYNIAKSGFFSSDRTIKQYINDIWGIDKL